MNDILKSTKPLGSVKKNIGEILLSNKECYGHLKAFAEKQDGKYHYRSWSQLVDDIVKFSIYLKSQNLKKGDRVACVSKNSYQRLVAEMAIMSMGYVSVAIFVGYGESFLNTLLDFSDIKLLVTDEDKFEQIKNYQGPKVLFGSNFQKYLDVESDITTDEITSSMSQVLGDDLCLIMYTSGTSQFPKGVMLTHKNILSQQKALEILWKPEVGMRLLCYLPWHHSFGGLFERFFALNFAGCLAIDDSFGRDTDLLFENFKQIRPHIYFSVPKIFQEIISRVLISTEMEHIFFHKDLKFVFTAAAPLPLSISDVFTKKKIPVVEGWGLTETSPCCTLTEFSLDRTPGVVGNPIPGVEIQLTDDGEILVKGPNVMKGYFKQKEKTEKVLESDGWFHTGDVGELTDEGVKIISRKDRVFKLSNGEKVYPTQIEESLQKKCKFIKHAYVFGKGKTSPLALLLPNYELLNAEEVGSLDDAVCSNPGCGSELKQCLKNCVKEVNQNSDVRYQKINKALIVEKELSLENNELTPSFKVVPRNIEKNYEKYIEYLENSEKSIPEDAHCIDLTKDDNQRGKK